ncbi:RhoGAP domain-containing protein [Tieghemostelium lacteum]|uniref:RhoGAP domain-containing protein n=1 Tax=Tieghemostelium lacteum TaxID=361077 RepID=A0A152A7X3_TIELA|nr:RhoGAP domain-containing protein [Tieghemostelium lacteum]|eukprot:KYR02231.1 RhoGAP domain-containing protein [Tieghemostelium lacteum]
MGAPIIDKILVILACTFILSGGVLSDQILYSQQSNGLPNNINENSQSMSIETSTNCGTNMNLCLKLTPQNTNAYYGFNKSGNGFDSSDNKFLELKMRVVNTTATVPIISVSIQTVSIPKEVTLTNTDYVSGKLIDGWQQVRIRLDQLNVDNTTSTFNGILIKCDITSAVIYFGDASLKLNPTSSVPLGYPAPINQNSDNDDKGSSTNTGKIAAAVLVPLFVVAIGVIVFLVWRKKKSDRKYHRDLYSDSSMSKYSSSTSTSSSANTKSNITTNNGDIELSNNITPKATSTTTSTPTPLPTVVPTLKLPPPIPTTERPNSIKTEPINSSNLANKPPIPSTSRPGSSRNEPIRDEQQTQQASPNNSSRNLSKINSDPQLNRENSKNSFKNTQLPPIPVIKQQHEIPPYQSTKSKPNTVKIAPILSQTITYLTNHGLYEEGILRLGGQTQEINYFKQQFDQGSVVDFETTPPQDIHSVGAILKKYLRENIEPLLPRSPNVKLLIEQCISRDDDKQSQLEMLKDLVYQSTPTGFSIMSSLFPFLAQISDLSQYNRMNNANLSMVFAPTLNFQPDLVDLLIRNSSALF